MVRCSGAAGVWNECLAPGGPPLAPEWTVSDNRGPTTPLRKVQTPSHFGCKSSQSYSIWLLTWRTQTVRVARPPLVEEFPPSIVKPRTHGQCGSGNGWPQLPGTPTLAPAPQLSAESTHIPRRAQKAFLLFWSSLGFNLKLSFLTDTLLFNDDTITCVVFTHTWKCTTQVTPTWTPTSCHVFLFFLCLPLDHRKFHLFQ